MTPGDVGTAVGLFRQQRAALPAMVIFTADDAERSSWTAAGPSKQVLVRIVAFAQASAQTILTQLRAAMATGQLPDEHVAFRTSLQDYQVLLYLKGSKLPNRACAVANAVC